MNIELIFYNYPLSGVTVLIQRPNCRDEWETVSEWHWHLGNETQFFPVAQTVELGTHNIRVKSSTSQGMQKLIKWDYFSFFYENISQINNSSAVAAQPVKFRDHRYCNNYIIKKRLIKTAMTKNQHQFAGNCSCMHLHWGSCILGFQIKTKFS